MTFLLLFAEFFKTGLFSVGGGLATLPFLSEMTRKYDWFSMSELMDMIAVSESTPGPIGVNMATYAGFSAGGLAGAVTATLGLVLPSFIVIVLISGMLDRFSENPLVKGAFSGLRPAAAGLIAAAGFGILCVSLFGADYSALNIPAAVFFALILAFRLKFEKLHPVIFIAAGAAAGLIFKF